MACRVWLNSIESTRRRFQPNRKLKISGDCLRFLGEFKRRRLYRAAGHEEYPSKTRGWTAHSQRKAIAFQSKNSSTDKKLKKTRTLNFRTKSKSKSQRIHTSLNHKQERWIGKRIQKLEGRSYGWMVVRIRSQPEKLQRCSGLGPRKGNGW